MMIFPMNLSPLKNSASLFLLVIATAVMSGCGETHYLLRYDKPEKEMVWPSLPDKPRFSFVGQLTGEDNLTAVDNGGAGAAIGHFFKALVGLGDESDRVRSLLRPQSGTVDALGRVIVTDAGRQALFVFDEKLGKMSVWRAATESLSFVSPVGVSVAKNGDVLVADAELRRVIRLDAQGNPKAEFGFGDLERPTGLAIDLANGHIYVSDTAEHNIKVYADNGTLLQIMGKVGTEAGEFNAPTHISFIDGKLYVTDTFNARVQVFDSKGKFIRSVGSRGLFMGNLVRPKGVTADSAGNIYIIESFHDYLLVYDQDARFLLPIGGTGDKAGEFYLPAGVWTDNRDRVYVADMYNGRVEIFQYLQGTGRSKLTKEMAAGSRGEVGAQIDGVK
jgi:DNA-binding beta-propeller fold protein YncE